MTITLQILNLQITFLQMNSTTSESLMLEYNSASTHFEKKAMKASSKVKIGENKDDEKKEKEQSWVFAKKLVSIYRWAIC